MIRTTIMKIIKIAVHTAAIAAAYKFISRKGYEDGYKDGNMAGACESCVYNDEPEDCPDIPDFEGLYS